MSNGNGKKMDWEKTVLWGLALLTVGTVSVLIYEDQKKKKLGIGAGGGAPGGTPMTTPAAPPLSPTQPPTYLGPGIQPPFGSGGTQVSFPVTGTEFDAFTQQATSVVTPGTPVVPTYTYTINTANDPLRSHVAPDVGAPVNGTFGRGAQVTSVEAPQVSADGRHWWHVMGTDSATGVPLLGWVDASYLSAL